LSRVSRKYHDECRARKSDDEITRFSFGPSYVAYRLSPPPCFMVEDEWDSRGVASLRRGGHGHGRVAGSADGRHLETRESLRVTLKLVRSFFPSAQGIDDETNAASSGRSQRAFGRPIPSLNGYLSSGAPSSSAPALRGGRRTPGIGRPIGWAHLGSATAHARAPVVTCAARRSAEAKMLPMLEKN